VKATVATVDLHIVMFQAQNKETVNSTWNVAVSFKIIDDERNKTTFHNTTPYLQDQDHSVQDQYQDRFFGLRPVLS